MASALVVINCAYWKQQNLTSTLIVAQHLNYEQNFLLWLILLVWNCGSTILCSVEGTLVSNLNEQCTPMLPRPGEGPFGRSCVYAKVLRVT
jgi:hypothetical protein